MDLLSFRGIEAQLISGIARVFEHGAVAELDAMRLPNGDRLARLKAERTRQTVSIAKPR
jgi:hypothetical protein